MAAIPANHCVLCRHQLVGLPVRHRCPECGEPYDEYSRGWAGSPWRTWGYAAMAIVIFGASPTLVREWIGQDTQLGATIFRILKRLWLGYAALVLGATFVFNRRGRFAAITPTGLHIRNDSDTVFIPWDDLAYVSSYDKASAIYRRNSKLPVRCNRVFLSREEADQFQRAVDKAQRAYREGT